MTFVLPTLVAGLYSLGHLLFVRDGALVAQPFDLSNATLKGKPDLMTVELSGDAKSRPFLATAFAESHAQFSPDGRWVAYVSDESGQLEVYVRRFPEGDGQKRISNAGGDQPRWRGDGREIFYLDPARRIVSVEITPGAELVPGTARPLFFTSTFIAVRIGFNFAVTRDGRRFLVNSTLDQPDRDPISILVNWMH